MSELVQLLAAITDSPDSSWALATVVGVSGSTYRLPGARQLLRADGTSVGTVSGGCLDADLVRVVGEVILKQRPRFVSYNLSADDDEIWGFGLGCNGVTEVLVEPAATAAPLLRELAEARDSAQQVAAVTVIDGPRIGARLLVRSDGSTTGSLGNDGLDRQAEADARTALAHGRHSRLALADTSPIFIEVQVPPSQLLVCGAGHDAIPMVRYGADLGWQVTVVDDRRAYLAEDRFPAATALTLGRAEDLLDLVAVTGRTDAVVMTHNYVRDVGFLRALLPSAVRYIGMLGPRARTDRMIDELRRDDVAMNDDSLNKVFAPAGLDIGAEGPDQIAWAILAEAQAVGRGRKGGPLRDRKGGIHQGLTNGRANEVH